MAIDTRNRRAACIGIRGLRLTGFPLSDGTIDANDRRQMTGLYPGISTDSREYIFWRETGDSGESWRGDTRGSTNLVPTSPDGEMWVPINETRDS